MAVFDRFRRNRQQSVLPDEVKQYYQSETRQRRGMAAILAVGALIATVAVASALFFGGRFVYHKVRGNDTKTAQPALENQGQTGEEQKPTESAGNGGGSQTPTTTPAPAESGTPPASTPSNPEPQAATPAPAPQPAPSPLPHTGDEGM